jgi:hypothetical protein
MATPHLGARGIKDPKMTLIYLINVLISFHRSDEIRLDKVIEANFLEAENKRFRLVCQWEK